jgi:hypothetical protein
MTSIVFLAAILGAPTVLGLPVAVHPSLKQLSLAARMSLAWTAGSLVLTMILTVLSAMRLNWTMGWILLACVIALATTSRLFTRSRAPASRDSNFLPHGLPFGFLALALVAVGGLFAFVFGVATSADLTYFWGTKGARFALERGIDFELLRQPYMIHLHPNYPPLWPVLLAWGAMIAGSMPWLAVPLLTWICLTAAVVIINSVLETRLDARAAAVVACLWYAVLTTMMVTSFSGGNADGPLVLFLSVALVVILTEPDDDSPTLRWLAAIALAGAVFTKSEGAIAALLIGAGTAIRDLVRRRPAVFRKSVTLITPAAVTAALWVAVRLAHDLPLTDPIRERFFHISFEHAGLILRVCARILISGAVVVGWLVPLVSVLLIGGKGLTRSLPGAVTAIGTLVFAGAYYLHATSDPLQLIVWTFPRLIQPALSAWILGLGVAVFSVTDEGAAETLLTQGSMR